jgi:hypothetical protein
MPATHWEQASLLATQWSQDVEPFDSSDLTPTSVSRQRLRRLVDQLYEGGARIIGGIAASHSPTIGFAYDRKSATTWCWVPAIPPCCRRLSATGVIVLLEKGGKYG